MATAAVVEFVGAENVERTIRGWGLDDSTVASGLAAWTQEAADPGPVSSASDFCSLLARLHRREVLRPESCDAILRILRAQRINDMLPRHIPVGEDWGDADEWIASKTGYGRCTVEIGIVHTRRLAFSLAVFFRPDERQKPRCKCLADHPPVLAVGEACRAVYGEWAGR
jgi:hypothetical protein